LLSIGVIAALVVGWQIAAFAGPVGTASGFEDDDGNLVDNPTAGIDWNSFAPVTWTGTAPTRQAHKTSLGWDLTGIEDWQATTSDSAFAGGTKQDKECASLITQKADNKADLKRVYIANKTLANGHVILNLAWVRIPQNTTTPSAHVAFEFNQSDEPCVASQPNGLVHRTVDDLLVLYDFEGGSAAPEISISRWTGSAWSAPDPLTSGEAEAAVNIAATALDTVGPTSETLGIKEFGEAGIDLTQAGVFPDQGETTECLTFGRTFGVTRTSGNSNTAQMKDIAGPADVNITNCGSLKVEKVDDAGTPLEGATFQLFVDNTPFDGAEPGAEDKDANGDLIPAEDADGNTLECTTELVDEDGDPATTDDQTATCTIDNVFFGHYWLDETVVPDGHSKASGLPAAVNINSTTTFEFAAPFENPRDTGSILVAKVDGNGTPLAGAEFALDEDGDKATTDDQTTIPPVAGQTGLFCIDGLVSGDYNVLETVSPDGYTPVDDLQEFTVDSASTCAERTADPVDDSDLTFTNIRNPGAILITKNAKDVNAASGSSPLAGVSFTVTSPGLAAGGVITEPTDDNGQTCLGGLTVGGTYTVTESDVPDGFEVDNTVTQNVEITDNAECGSGNEDQAGPFENDPLSEIEVQFRSLAQNANGDDRTAATIDCEDATEALTATPPDDTSSAFDDSSETFTNLKEGSYNCTVVIDP
jgi:hypothetical protein